jgi:hypothetical protein
MIAFNPEILQEERRACSTLEAIVIEQILRSGKNSRVAKRYSASDIKGDLVLLYGSSWAEDIELLFKNFTRLKNTLGIYNLSFYLLTSPLWVGKLRDAIKECKEMSASDIKSKLLERARITEVREEPVKKVENKSAGSLFYELYTLKLQEYEQTTDETFDVATKSKVARICSRFEDIDEVKKFIDFVFMNYLELKKYFSTMLSISFISTDSVLQKIMYFQKTGNIPKPTVVSTKYKDVTHRHSDYDDYESDSLDRIKNSGVGNTSNPSRSSSAKH